MMLSSFLLVAAATLALAHDYSDVDTRFNFEPLATDRPALRRQMDCYLDRGPCGQLEEHYKRHIREALSDACAGCSPKYKHNIWTFLKDLMAVFPEDYIAFRAKYDPEGTRFDLIEDAVRKF